MNRKLDMINTNIQSELLSSLWHYSLSLYIFYKNVSNNKSITNRDNIGNSS